MADAPEIKKTMGPVQKMTGPIVVILFQSVTILEPSGPPDRAGHKGPDGNDI